MLTIKYQAAFKKDYKRIVKRGYDMRLLEKVTGITNFPGTMRDAASVTLPRIGC